MDVMSKRRAGISGSDYTDLHDAARPRPTPSI